MSEKKISYVAKTAIVLFIGIMGWALNQVWTDRGEKIDHLVELHYRTDQKISGIGIAMEHYHMSNFKEISGLSGRLALLEAKFKDKNKND